jgi:hypothetical protein
MPSAQPYDFVGASLRAAFPQLITPVGAIDWYISYFLMLSPIAMHTPRISPLGRRQAMEKVDAKQCILEERIKLSYQ